jgi:hypothetical protein
MSPKRERRAAINSAPSKNTSVGNAKHNTAHGKGNDGPTVLGFTGRPLGGGNVSIVFWCENCGVLHYHGGDPNERLTHRVAHCWRRPSPLEERGVLIRIVGPLPPWCHGRYQLTKAEAARLTALAAQLAGAAP